MMLKNTSSYLRDSIGRRASAVLAITAIFIVSAGWGAIDIDGARAAIEKWVEVRRVISQEKRDWDLSREILNERIAMMQREIDSVGTATTKNDESITETDRKRAELVDQNDRFKEAAAALTENIQTLEQRTGELLKRLPEPIRDRVKLLSQRLPSPERGAPNELSLGERYQNVVGILNEINKFNREITVVSEVRTLPDGTAAEVTALYIGISQGYYVDAREKAAGIGSPTEQGWTWRSANDAAPQIARAIAILKKEKVAEYVLLPIHID